MKTEVSTLRKRIVYASITAMLFFIGLTNLYAQVAINTDGSNPDNSAMLDVMSDDKGLLVPRVALTGTTDNTTIVSPAVSLLIYNTATVSDVTPGYYYYNGSSWTRLATDGSLPAGWSLTGNAGTNPAVNFLGTTDNQPLIFKQNGVQAGRIDDNRLIVGSYAGVSNTGQNNTFLGPFAGRKNTSGGDNTFVGSSAGFWTTTGGSNSFFGEGAGNNLSSGSLNTFIGQSAARSTSSGSENTWVGQGSGQNASGSFNSFLGRQSGAQNGGNYNTFIGYQSAFNVSAGSDNTFIGKHSGINIGNSSQNTLLGANTDLPNTGLFNATAIGYRAKVESSNSMVLGSVNGINGATASVRVGIGTTTPQEQLHVVGNIRMVDGNQAAGMVMVSDGNGTASWGLLSPSPDNDWTISGNNMHSTVPGNVGIGTTNPTAKLEVISPNSNSGIYTESVDGWSLHSNSFGSNGVSVAAISSDGVGVYAESNSAGIAKLASGPDNAAGYFQGNVFVQNGNMGIGTLSPTAKLDVISSTSNSGIYTESIDGWSLHSNSFGSNGVSVAALADQGTGVYAESANGSIAKLASGPDNAAGYFQGNVFVQNGNMGIGTINPSAKLDVISPNSNSGIYTESVDGWSLHSNSFGSNGVSVAALADQGTGVYAESANGGIAKLASGPDNAAGYFEGNIVVANGLAGIGTTSPQEELHVVGNIRMVDGNQGAGKVMVSDANGTGSWQSINTNSSSIIDGDNDTEVTVESNPDEDIVRFTIAGIERMFIDSTRLDLLFPDSSTVIGHRAGFENALLTDPGQDDQGKFNTFLGYYSGYNNNPDPFVSSPYNFNDIYEGGSGSNNTFLGNKTGLSNSQGRNNLFAGSMAGLNNSGQGDFNVGEGGTGSENTFLGFLSGHKNTDGHWNTFVGAYSGEMNGLGVSNFNTQSSFNTYIGANAGRFNQPGTRNTYIGSQAGGDFDNDAGDKNVYIGSKAGFKNTGNENVFIGTDAGFSPLGDITPANNNTFIGTEAGFNNKGDFNVFVGNDAGNTNTGGGLNTVLGANADVGAINLTNASAIGSNAQVDQSNSLVLGSINGVNGATASTNVGIGTTTPQDELHVVGNIRMVDGNQGLDKVMVSDGNGTASWGTIPAVTDNDWTISGNNLISAVTGNVGIGTNSPVALLHTQGTGTGQGNVLFTGEFKSIPGPAPVSGAGTRMMWYPDKAAFRAGGVFSTEWDTDFVGDFSFAAGGGSIASANTSTAMGAITTASGVASTALGNSTIASGSVSIAMGDFTTASGDNSTAMGTLTNASGNVSTAMGNQTNAIGASSTAMGGLSTASGNFSTAMGRSTVAPSFAETVIGAFNTEYTPGSATLFNTGDRLFVIGNGTGSTNRKDAMVVMKSGNVGFGTSTPNTQLEVEKNSETGIRITTTSNDDLFLDFKRTATDFRIKSSGGTLFFSSSADDFATVTDLIRISSTFFRPDDDNVMGLGSSSNRWTSVFAVNGTIQTSDAKLKKNISPLNYGLDAVMQLKPVSYQWNDQNIDKGRDHIGFLAQDLQKVLPEVVVDHEWKEIPDTDKKEWVPSENLGVNYAEITPVLVKAIQEQQQIIEELKSRIEELEKKSH